MIGVCRCAEHSLSVLFFCLFIETLKSLVVIIVQALNSDSSHTGHVKRLQRRQNSSSVTDNLSVTKVPAPLQRQEKQHRLRASLCSEV